MNYDFLNVQHTELLNKYSNNFFEKLFIFKFLEVKQKILFGFSNNRSFCTYLYFCVIETYKTIKNILKQIGSKENF